MSRATLALSVPKEPFFLSHPSRQRWNDRLSGSGYDVVDLPSAPYASKELYSDEDKEILLGRAAALVVSLCYCGASLPLDPRSAELIEYTLVECGKPVFTDSSIEAEAWVRRAGEELRFDPADVVELGVATDLEKINETLAGVR